MVPASRVTCQLVPPAAAYCTDHPETSTGAEPALNNSMKSFFQVAPEFPPPPYTSLTTTSGEVADATWLATAEPATASARTPVAAISRRTAMGRLLAVGKRLCESTSITVATRHDMSPIDILMTTRRNILNAACLA